VQRSVAQLPSGYAVLLKDIKARVRAAQLRAGLTVNRELVLLYWHIGREILARQKQEGWGAKVIDRLSRDLSREFPEMSGLSPRNLKYMRAFAEAWPEEPFVQQLAAQMPWFHNCVLLDKVADTEARRWYVRATVEHGWSRNGLAAEATIRKYRIVQTEGVMETWGKATLVPTVSGLPAVTIAKQLVSLSPWGHDV
jgi:predicted nuclease of restriction endonuclease-like (RecB) superfamily